MVLPCNTLRHLLPVLLMGLISLPAMVGCTSEDTVNPESMLSRATDWQEREEASYSGTLDLDISEIAKITHDLAGEFSFRSDAEQFGVEDYWQTSEEISESMAGDCEDWSIIVYTALSEIGYDQDFLGIVIFTEGNGYHLVPALFPNGRRDISTMMVIHQDGSIYEDISCYETLTYGFDYRDFWTY